MARVLFDKIGRRIAICVCCDLAHCSIVCHEPSTKCIHTHIYNRSSAMNVIDCPRRTRSIRTHDNLLVAECDMQLNSKNRPTSAAVRRKTTINACSFDGDNRFAKLPTFVQRNSVSWPFHWRKLACALFNFVKCILWWSITIDVVPHFKITIPFHHNYLFIYRQSWNILGYLGLCSQSMHLVMIVFKCGCITLAIKYHSRFWNSFNCCCWCCCCNGTWSESKNAAHSQRYQTHCLSSSFTMSLVWTHNFSATTSHNTISFSSFVIHDESNNVYYAVSSTFWYCFA